MKIIKLKSGTPLPKDAALAIPLWSDEPSARNTLFSTLPDGLWNEVEGWIKQIRFKATEGSFSHGRVLLKERLYDVFLFGCGPGHQAHAGILRRAGGRAAVEAQRLGVSTVAPVFPERTLTTFPNKWVRAFAIGFYEGTYQLRPSKDSTSKPLQLALQSSAPAALSEDLKWGISIGSAINKIRDIANQPGNQAPPRVIANHAQALAKELGISCSIWDRAELKKQRCHAILAVGQGSSEEPRLIRLTYPGRKKNLRPLVVVGKTITFDTGGISLKPSKNMEWMKFDKCGGMTVLAFMAIVASVIKPDRPVIGILTSAENMPSGTATRPGDIIQSRSGKTIEVLNTDAEGRLVLADALDIASELKPHCIIDLATLTGAASVALGRPASPIMANDNNLLKSLQEAGDAVGDRVWPLPLFPDYERMLNSPFADLKNIGDGSAGTIIGGTFLKFFVRPDIPWAHIDLTSAWEERATSHGPAGATLFGAALLAQWLESITTKTP
ncbi:MAG: leucyl aminopeptidase family protein [Kiritimatiellae bacterium]|nr:leucyl aminopeptidase family protein [Kiritimatiellia bacterium]